MSLVKKIVFSKYAGILILAVLITFLILLLADKYSTSLVSSELSGPMLSRYYHDLDQDGNSEKIEFHKYAEKKASLLVFKNNQIIEQWNFDGLFGNSERHIFNDFDNDGLDEVIFFIQQEDYLYLNCIDPISKEVEFSMIPLCKLIPVNGNYTYSISSVNLCDVNRDGIKEIFFTIMTGFSTRPRNMFAFYPVEEKVFVSPESCANIDKIFIFDLDRDSIPEIFGSNIAHGNCSYERQYSDMFSWLMVFTPEMEFWSPPVIVGEYPSMTEFIPFVRNNERYILCMHWYRGSEDISDYIALFDHNGTKVLNKEIENEEFDGAIFFPEDSSFNSVFLLSPGGEILNIKENLEFNKIAEIGEVFSSSPVRIDVDGDGEREYIFLSQNRQSLIITRVDFSNPVSFSFSGVVLNLAVSLIESESDSPLISLDAGSHILDFSYDHTLVYKYWYILTLLICIVELFIISLVNKIHEFREIRISNTRRQIVELQMKSVQNQLDPHFTFNILQSFGNLIAEKDTERAEYLFNKYAGMLKTTVLNGDKVFIPLQEEFDFAASYLDLEMLRQRDRFSYQMNISEEIDTSIQIPKMLLHTFIENAIKHGLRHLKSGGKLDIEAMKQNGTIVLTITDNGVGRKRASEYKGFSTGKGLRIMDQILDLYFQLFKTRIRYNIIDLKDEKNPIGTKIIIIIPT